MLSIPVYINAHIYLYIYIWRQNSNKTAVVRPPTTHHRIRPS